MDNQEEDLAKKEELLREREEALQKREEQLKEKESQMQSSNAKERFYDTFRNVPVKYIDYLIAACGVAIIVCVILGMMKGRGIF